MPRKPIRRVTTETEIIEPDEREPVRSTPLSPLTEESYLGFVGKFVDQEGVKVKVYRQTQNGRAYCFQGLPPEIDEEAIRIYHAKQPYARESGLYFLHVFVQGEPRNSFPVEISPQLPDATVPTSSNGVTGYDTVRMLQDQIARLEQRLLTQDREPLSAIADTFLKLNAMRQQQEQPREIPVDSMIRLIELGQKMNGTAPIGESESWLSALGPVLKELAPLAMPLLSSLLGNRPRVAVDPMQPTGEKGNPAPMLEAKNNSEFLQGIAFLKQKCLAGSNPLLYVEIILDNADTPNYQQLIREVLNQEFSAFEAIDADLKSEPYHNFFVTLFNGLRSAFKEPDPVVSAPTGSAGHAPDAKNNGSAGKASGRKS